ncbi:MAG: hypothetical protein V1897_09545 [Pseudomonadota bacterium]
MTEISFTTRDIIIQVYGSALEHHILSNTVLEQQKQFEAWVNQAPSQLILQKRNSLIESQFCFGIAYLGARVFEESSLLSRHFYLATIDRALGNNSRSEYFKAGAEQALETGGQILRGVALGFVMPFVETIAQTAHYSSAAARGESVNVEQAYYDVIIPASFAALNVYGARAAAPKVTGIFSRGAALLSRVGQGIKMLWNGGIRGGLTPEGLIVIVADGVVVEGASVAAAELDPRALLPMASVGNLFSPNLSLIATLLSRLSEEQCAFVRDVYTADDGYTIEVERMRELFPEPAGSVPPNQWTAEQWARVILEDYTTHPQLWHSEFAELRCTLRDFDTMLSNIEAWKVGSFRYDGSTFSWNQYYNNMPRSLATGVGTRRIWEIALERQRPDLLVRLREKAPQEFRNRQNIDGYNYSQPFTSLLDEIINVLEGSEYRGLYDPTIPTVLGR